MQDLVTQVYCRKHKWSLEESTDVHKYRKAITDQFLQKKKKTENTLRPTLTFIHKAQCKCLNNTTTIIAVSHI